MFAALIPGIATQVTVYKIMYSLGLINHLYGYMIVLMGTDIISIYIFLQFFENLPVSLDESEGRGCLQRVLHVQPVSAERGTEDHFHSPL